MVIISGTVILLPWFGDDSLVPVLAEQGQRLGGVGRQGALVAAVDDEPRQRLPGARHQLLPGLVVAGVGVLVPDPPLPGLAVLAHRAPLIHVLPDLVGPQGGTLGGRQLRQLGALVEDEDLEVLGGRRRRRRGRGRRRL